MVLGSIAQWCNDPEEAASQCTMVLVTPPYPSKYVS
jgi:hypothetical protein